MEDNELSPLWALPLLVIAIFLIFTILDYIKPKTLPGEFIPCENTYCNYVKVCIDGKEFISGYRQISINLDMNGKPIPCGENK